MLGVGAVNADRKYLFLPVQPGHDTRDWEFARAHGLEIVEVSSGGNLDVEAYSGDGKLVNSGIGFPG